MHASSDLKRKSWLEISVLANTLAPESLINRRIHDHGTDQEVETNVHESQNEVVYMVWSVVYVRLSIILASIINPIDRFHLNNLQRITYMER